MMEKKLGKIVCPVLVNGEEVTKVVTTAASTNLSTFVKVLPGVGKPFWYWPSIPAGTVLAADFTNAPIVSADPAVNAASIAAITADPLDVLTYA
jgi:hypothetical protein